MESTPPPNRRSVPSDVWLFIALMGTTSLIYQLLGNRDALLTGLWVIAVTCWFVAAWISPPIRSGKRRLIFWIVAFALLALIIFGVQQGWISA